MPPKSVETDPNVIRAALVFVEPPAEEQLSGTIIEPLDIDPMNPMTWSFGLTPDGGAGDICVRVNEDAAVLLVNTTDSEVTMGSVADLALDQSVDLLGTMSDCFDASEVIVNVSPAP